jgi:hypothetical protein
LEEKESGERGQVVRPRHRVRVVRGDNAGGHRSLRGGEASTTDRAVLNERRETEVRANKYEEDDDRRDHTFRLTRAITINCASDHPTLVATEKQRQEVDSLW